MVAQQVIQMEAVSKAFGRHQVLDDMHLSVPSHSVFGLVGNGADGKSSVLRLLAGLLHADRGKIAVLGLDVRAQRLAVLRQTGILIDTPALYPTLTGAEMLRIGCTLKRLPASDIARVLALVNLAGSANRPISNYCAQMKQRLALAHALLGAPKLLLLDEPTARLDAEGVRDMGLLLRSMPATAGATVLLTSRSFSNIDMLCTHVALLRGGKIGVQAPLADLLARQAGLMEIDVNDSTRAQQLLQSAAYLVERITGSRLRVCGVERHQTDRVHALLIHAGIRLYQSVYQTPSLEQWFTENFHAA